MEIKNRNGIVIYERDAESFKDLVEEAVKSGVNLGYADLRVANLGVANLGYANLGYANLRGADLGEPGTLRINWRSHALVSEILWRASGGQSAREQLAAWIDRKTNWCWKDWAVVDHPEREWALDELVKWVRDDDEVPELLRERKKAGNVSP